MRRIWRGEGCMRRWTTTLAVALLAAAGALCGCGEGEYRPDAGSDGGSIFVAVIPPTINVPPYGQARLLATVTGAADTSVIWSVQEAGGGTVVNQGASARYQAPGVEGIY